MKKHLITVATLTLAVMLTTFTSCRKPQAEDNTPAKEGLYLGIVGFNSDLYTMPLGLLNQETKNSFTSFVDGLAMQNGTMTKALCFGNRVLHQGRTDTATRRRWINRKRSEQQR